MCEVTKTNFNELFDEIEENFKKSVFLSIDCEFSALTNGGDFMVSLFDTPCERYRIMKENLKNAIPLEIGITGFIFNRDCGMYIAKPYKFYVYPVHFGLIDKVFVCQASSLHFLGEHQFDFNKVIYCGIPYLTKTQEKQIKQYIKDDCMYDYCKFSLGNLKSEEITLYLSETTDWFVKKKAENEKTLFDIKTQDPTFLYVLHVQIRNRFPNIIWTFEENQKFKVRRVCAEKYKSLCETEKLDVILLDNLLGFTKVYRLLESLKKPIVGHNCFLDLLLLVSSFDNALPNSYIAFKKQVNESFPKIYDTKSISFDLFHSLPKENRLPNGLKDLYGFFRNEAGRHLAPHSPRIDIAEGFKTTANEKFHDAGWDAYCTGYCFIRMAHYFASKNTNQKMKIIMSSHLLKAVEHFVNQVNVIRATTPYLNFSGPDPESNRPPCLIIESKNKKPVDIFKVTELLRLYGSVDIRPYSGKGTKVIAAIANFGSFRRILGKFHDHKEYHIVTYNALKHSPVVRAALWGGAISSAGVVAWIIHSQILTS